MNKLSFSGHETFHCRHFWLKKGYDYISKGKQLSDENAIIDLGVGKNMVTSIKYWLKAFQLIDVNNQPTEIADKIFSDNGYDPFLEDTGTLWLLHYNLVTSENIASIYTLVFNDFIKERPEYTNDILLGYLRRKALEYGVSFNEKTVTTDISVFKRTYIKPEKTTKAVEDDFAALLLPLDLIKPLKQKSNEEVYQFSTDNKDSLPLEILLYTIIKTQKGNVSISFENLLDDWNSIGNVFLLTPNDLYVKLDLLAKKFDFITFFDDAGIKELQFKGNLPNSTDILDEYYKQ